ncbi:Hypothetical predicted protein, partial [Mytilus galloprovincialis]
TMTCKHLMSEPVSVFYWDLSFDILKITIKNRKLYFRKRDLKTHYMRSLLT